MTGTVLELDKLDLEQALRMAETFGTDRYAYVVTPNADHIIRFYDDASFRDKYADAGYVLCDSRFLANILAVTKHIQVPVCTGSDLTAGIISRIASKQDQLVLVGGSCEQAETLRRQYGFTHLSHLNPPMGFIRDAAEVEKVLEFVEQHSPFRFCLLAVGCPQQEAIAQRLKQRGVARGLALCIGASVDFLTGKEQRAPKVFQALGMEWVFRLLQSPRRLGKRYLVRGPRIFAILTRIGIRLRDA